MLSIPTTLSQAILATSNITHPLHKRSPEPGPAPSPNLIYLRHSMTPKVHQSYDFSTRKISTKKGHPQNEEIKIIENKVQELKQLQQLKKKKNGKNEQPAKMSYNSIYG